MSGGFRNFRALGDAFLRGQTHTAHFRKIPSQSSGALQWIDLSMAGGNPVPNYYASSPLEAATLNGFRGVFHGDDKSPAQMRVVEMELCTPSSAFIGQFSLLDYLLYYPFIDFDDTGEQVMVNDTPLPRYSDGAGVRAMLVAAAPTVGGGSFTYNYINQDGIAKTSPVISCNTSADAIATIATSQQGTVARGQAFLPMADGDTGIRSIVSHQMITPNGGLGVIVLVRPICDATIREINVPDWRSYVFQVPGAYAPLIHDGAYLNFICNPASTALGAILTGRVTFVWN